ncbi:MAG TPA: FtsW/RodA/SpoVE family cell cycle protein [Clostridiales bacterium]|nr:FtsW/RodA/SpoVE family cell cycle protein [Clostridiales bacterium]
MSLIVQLTKYLMILLMGIYSYYSFTVFRSKSKRYQKRIYITLTMLIFLLHFVGYATLFLQIPSMKLLVLYGGEMLLLTLVLGLYQLIYPKMPRLLLRNMLMLLVVSFIMLARLNYDMAVKQVIIVAFSFLACLLVPLVMRSRMNLRRFGWFYGFAGIGVLSLVLLVGTTKLGATNWISIAGFSVQPSEFVKLLFVLCVAALFKEQTSFRRVCAVTFLAAVHVLLLVAQTDLGGALIFFVTYLFILYIASANPLYLFAGLLGGSGAAMVAYRLFYHVRVRVMAWQNPFAYIDKEGYQITQSLFAIGTGGWFGMGLNRGLPTSIPVVESDFIFSAISEEFGGLFVICIILIYVSCFVMFINIALEQEVLFYRLTAVGFAVMFIFQVFLSIGGVIKFIPSTGVTLPLISQGGSSVFATIVMFMILQGIAMKEKKRNRDIGNKKNRKKETKEKNVGKIDAENLTMMEEYAPGADKATYGADKSTLEADKSALEADWGGSI